MEKDALFENRPVQIDDGLVDKYLNLFYGFQGYYRENFTPECQEDASGTTFAFGSRIRYAITCATEGLPIPPDCAYEQLLQEMYETIQYRETVEF